MARNQDENTNMHSYKPNSGSKLQSPGAKMAMYLLFVLQWSSRLILTGKESPSSKIQKNNFNMLGVGETRQNGLLMGGWGRWKIMIKRQLYEQFDEEYV